MGPGVKIELKRSVMNADMVASFLILLLSYSYAQISPQVKIVSQIICKSGCSAQAPFPTSSRGTSPT